MRNLNLMVAGGLTLVAATSCGEQKKVQEVKKPNIIYILADDMGYGDLSCYGQDQFTTPNLDKMAANGIRFTDHYAGCTVSAPSRSVLMSGQHTGHTSIRGNKELDGEGQSPMSGDTYTIAEMFKDAGYVTGAFGKWGLGFPGSEGDPNMQGFDEFFGYNCQRQAHRYYPEHLWHNQEKFMLEGNDLKNKVTYAPDLIQEKALDFIRANKDGNFFAFVPIVQPHAEMLAPDDEILAQFKGKFEEKPHIDKRPGANYGDENFNFMYYCSQEAPFANYAAMVTRVDLYVGQIMALLEELGIAENTLVLFSSDNGCTNEGGYDANYFNSNGPLRGFKRDLTDGGIRSPFIASWKGTIPAGQVSAMPSAFWDMMPTFAEAIGVKAPASTDGISILPELKGDKVNQKQHEYLYWEFPQKGAQAVRIGDMKVLYPGILKDKVQPAEVYNLSTDIGEENNIASENLELIKKADSIIKAAHTTNDRFKMYFEK